MEQAEKLPPERQAATREPETLSGPLFQIAGMFAIGEPGWADQHDEAFAWDQAFYAPGSLKMLLKRREEVFAEDDARETEESG